MSFDEALKVGRLAESAIAKWFMRRGYNVFPAYEVENGNYKGPRIFGANGELISPDLFVFKPEAVFWVEAKSKAAFTWYRIGQNYQDGIDKKCWLDYLKLAQAMYWPVWLLFLHGPGQVAKDNPEGMVPPTGLFGQDISELKNRVDHESDKWGRTGMVYWNVDSLIRVATWNEVAGVQA